MFKMHMLANTGISLFHFLLEPQHEYIQNLVLWKDLSGNRLIFDSVLQTIECAFINFVYTRVVRKVRGHL